METENNTPKVKIGYDYLKELCAFNADFNAFSPRQNPITNRVEYIMHQLRAMDVDFTTDTFNATDITKDDGNLRYVNIKVLFKGTNQNETVAFVAHHDIANKASENAQDNTASVCNLLDLISKLKGKELIRNVLVCFTDAEETVDVFNSGASKLAMDITSMKYGRVPYAVNLELTGLGKKLWVSTFGQNELFKKCIELGAKFKQTPYSDTMALTKNGVVSVCIGILPEHEINGQFPSTWRLCHSMSDTADKCNEQDMTEFVDNVLMRLI